MLQHFFHVSLTNRICIKLNIQLTYIQLYPKFLIHTMSFQTYYNNDSCTEADFKKSLKFLNSYKRYNLFVKVLKHYNCENVIPNTLAEFKTRCLTDPKYRKTLVLVDSIIRDLEQCDCENIPYEMVYKNSMKYIHIYDYSDDEEFFDISQFAEYCS